MSEPIINWEKLVPYERDQCRSFEEFCYQIATTLHEPEGRFTSVDDSGGGDGVEFYLTLPEGEQWGWQAKFYRPDVRLSSSRKTKIKESLQRACEQHPRMTKWVLCTNGNLTHDEQKWFEENLRSSEAKGRSVVPKERSLQIIHWSESDFIAWMSEERFAGIKLNFFGELELTRKWFINQFQKQLAGVKDKFDPALHTETHVDEEIHRLLGDKQFQEKFQDYLKLLTEDQSRLKDRTAALSKGNPQSLDRQNIYAALLQPAQKLECVIAEILAAVQEVYRELAAGGWQTTRDYDWDALLNRIDKEREDYNKVAEGIDVGKVKYQGTEEREDGEQEARRLARQTITGPARSAAEFTDQVQAIKDRLAGLKQPDLHVFGSGGLGKTHLSCHVCQDKLNEGLPAIFVVAAHFTSDETLERQLLKILDIPSTYSWNDFLRAVDSVAHAYRCRIPIIIDGLNEAIVNGVFSGVWKRGLPGLRQEFERTRSVVLITTCRSSYQRAIWGTTDPQNIRYIYGFDESNVRLAVERYFSAYKIKADLTAAPLDQFRHPIYLKMYCQVANPERKEERQIYVGEQSLFKTFDAYLDHCDDAISHHLGLRPGTRVATQSVNKLAGYLWERRARRVPLNKAVQLIDGKARDDLIWQNSKTQACESEGLLVCRDYGADGEELFFTYDVLGGYLIARSLIADHKQDLAEFLNSEQTKQTLYADDLASRHPLHEDIRRSLAALLPVEAKGYLHNLVDNDVAFGDSVNALFEISPEHIDSSCPTLIADLFQAPEARTDLFELSRLPLVHPGHPLNARFWHQQLKALPMPDRDESWTEYVRETAEAQEDLLREFEERCRSGAEFSGPNEERLHLLAIRTLWLLTSTLRPLRDKGTKAIYWYGRRFPGQFFDLLLDSLDINDPCVPERMLAAACGTAMACQHDPRFTSDQLPRWGRTFYERIFAPGAPNATTHILSRDYARMTVEIAVLHNPAMLTEDEAKRIRPPFKDGGIREWGESEDKNEGQYKNGNSPLGSDFENYTLGSLLVTTAFED